MLTIIHGSDVAASRNFLNSQIETFRSAGSVTIRSDGTGLTSESLNLDLQPTALFDQERVIIIENLFARRESAEKKAIINILNANSLPQVIIWEGKGLRASDLANFSQKETKEFNLKPTVFAFLDSLGQSPAGVLASFHLAMQQDPPEKLMASLGSRLKLLLIAKVDEANLSAQGFYRSKILTQSRSLTTSQLKGAFSHLLELDYLQKTGQSSQSLSGALDLFLTTI